MSKMGKYREKVKAGACWTCGGERKKYDSYCNRCKVDKKTAKKRWQLSIMQDLIDMYGGKCACCGEETFQFLTIDHMNNDGAAERRLYGEKGGYGFYSRLLRKPKRDDLQVLCFNCNCGRQRNGGVCPHQHLSNSSDAVTIRHIDAIIQELLPC